MIWAGLFVLHLTSLSLCNSADFPVRVAGKARQLIWDQNSKPHIDEKLSKFCVVLLGFLFGVCLFVLSYIILQLF